MSDDANQAVSEWMTAYRTAWESNERADIEALFSADATYFYEPFDQPIRGREAIVASWLERQDAPGTTEFTWHPLVVTDEIAIVQGETIYPSIRYSNLWVIRLGTDGRATEFTEWWMDQSKPAVP